MVTRYSTVLPLKDLGAWREIAHWPDYIVSRDGRICSFRTANAGFITPNKGRVRLRAGRGDTQRSRYMSLGKIVLEAFVGLAPSADHYATHLDCNAENNHISNLEWRTRYE